MGVVDITVLAHQEAFMIENIRHPAIVGGLGSGKSEGGLLRMMRIMLEDKDANIFYGMPTYDLLRQRAIPGMESLLIKAGISHTVNKSSSEIQIHGRGKIIFRSYDNPARIIAFEVAHGILDELDTLPFEKAEFVWRKVTERIRQTTDFMLSNDIENTLAVATTPDSGFSGYIYHRWVDKADKHTRIIKASTLDNPFLPDSYIEQIRANYDEKMAELYLNGEFVNLKGKLVYPYFNREEHHIDSEELDISKNDEILVGMDFNIGSCVSIVCVEDYDSGEVYAIREIIEHDTYKTAETLKLEYGDYHQIISHPDASGASRSTNSTQTDTDILAEYGIIVNAPKSNPQIRDRVLSMNNMFRKNKLFIDTHKCPQLTRSIERQMYDESGKPEKFDVHPAMDDWNDSLSYLIYRRYPVLKPQMGQFKSAP